MLLPVRVDLSMGADANGFCARLQGGPNSRQRQLFRFTSMRQSFPFVLCFRLLNRLPLHV
jgi:hypothetical protein